MLDGFRSAAYKALRSHFGNQIPPVRWAKDLALYLNEMAGKPLAPRADGGSAPTWGRATAPGSARSGPDPR